MISITNIPLLFGMSPLLAQETSDYTTAPSGPGPVFWIVYSAVILLFIAAMWKVFSKAGQPGWAAIIPIYNWIVWCKIVGRPAWWVLLLLLCFPIFFIILSIDLAKSFGKGGGFAAGLILLPFFFLSDPWFWQRTIPGCVRSDCGGGLINFNKR